MKRKPFLSELKKVLSNDKQKVDRSFYGVVQDVVADEHGKVKAYKINLGGEESTVEARKFAGANIGDTVMCMLMANGQMVITGTRDGDQDAEEARKYATNYIKDTGDGISLERDTSAVTQGKNVYIGDDGVYIRNGEIVNASFKEDEIELGKNNPIANIELVENFSIKGEVNISSEGLEYDKALKITPEANTGTRYLAISSSPKIDEFDYQAGQATIRESETFVDAALVSHFQDRGAFIRTITYKEVPDDNNIIIGIGGYDTEDGSITPNSYIRLYDGAFCVGNKYAADYPVYLGLGEEKNSLSIKANISINGKGLEDYIVEQDTKDGWHYVKWASGKAEAWGELNNVSCSFSAVGNVYRSQRSFSIPSGIFNNVPKHIDVSIISNVAVWLGNYRMTGTQSGEITVFRYDGATTGLNVRMHIISFNG